MNKRILLLTSVPPTKNKTGGLILDQLCRFMPKDSIVCYTIVDRVKYPRLTPNLDWIPIKYFLRYNEYIRTFIPSRIAEFIDNFYQKVIINNLRKFVLKNEIDVIWCVLEGLTLIRLGSRIKKELDIPLITQVWDPPEWWLRVRKVSPKYQDSILQEFGKAIKESRVCATTSWVMSKEYHNKYGVETIPFLPSLPSDMALKSSAKPHDRNEYIIALAGQIYAKEEWNALISALDQIDWRINNRSVKINLIGRFNIEKRPGINFMGWQSQPNTIKLLSESDLLYCPYWFDPAYEKETRLSFPSKLTTYLASSRPVFFHGPAYASVSKFLVSTKSGYTCHSLKPNDIIDLLTNAFTDTNLYSELSTNGRQAFDEYFTTETLKTNFDKFINIGLGLKE
ncbi:MAG: glycosyl transferase [Patescibacteria group bacterium]